MRGAATAGTGPTKRAPMSRGRGHDSTRPRVGGVVALFALLLLIELLAAGSGSLPGRPAAAVRAGDRGVPAGPGVPVRVIATLVGLLLVPIGVLLAFQARHSRTCRRPPTWDARASGLLRAGRPTGADLTGLRPVCSIAAISTAFRSTSWSSGEL